MPRWPYPNPLTAPREGTRPTGIKSPCLLAGSPEVAAAPAVSPPACSGRNSRCRVPLRRCTSTLRSACYGGRAARSSQRDDPTSKFKLAHYLYFGGGTFWWGEATDEPSCFFKSLFENPPGEGTGPTRVAESRDFL
jgi:hypothetical protein